MIPLLDRANRALLAGRDAEAEVLMDELLAPQPSPLAWISRLWHRLTCRQPSCIWLFGAYQHPRGNRKLRS